MFERLRRGPASGALQFDPASLQGLAAGSPNLVAIAVDGVLAFANPAAESFLGALARKPVLELIHHDDRARWLALDARIRETGQAPVWAGVRLIRSDGRPVELDVSATPVEYGGERAVMLVGRDNSETHRAHAALVESERRYQSLAAAAPVAIYRLDSDGKCVYLNRRFSELTGIPIEEALGRSWLELVSDQGKSLAREAWRRMVAEAVEIRAEQIVRHRDGSTLQVLAQVVPETDANGHLVGWVGTLTDLTDLKVAELALARSEARLRLALQAASMVSWEADLASGRIEWSEGAAAVLGFEPGALPSNIDFGAALAGRNEITFRSGRELEALRRDVPFEFELRLTPEGAEPRWILARGGPGEGRRIVGVVADMTERRRTAEEHARLEQKLVEAQRLESLGLLAGGVAHDFNNLLVGILGNAELALERLHSDASARALVEGIRDAGVRAAELARQILAYSGHEPMARQRVDLADLVREVLGLLHASLPANARLAVDAADRLPCVEGDATQLRQVLMNLLLNAAESLPKQGGDVRVRLEPVIAQAGDDALATEWLALEVEDTGAGMDAQTRARIFDPFYTTRANGRGLGLAVVHGIVRAHGGTIEVSSEPGVGTRMRVLLPASAQPLAARATALASAAPAKVDSALVLVVDDERAVREVVRLALEAAGHRVLLAANGAETRALLDTHGRAIDAIVLDLTLGPETSEGVLAEIRARTGSVPVLVTSGYPEEQAIARLAALGVSAFVQKPFTPARLNESVSRVLAERARRRDS